MKLRPYQQRVIDDLWAWMAREPEKDPIVDASVGAGKSLIIAAIAQRIAREAPGARVLVLVHQKELLEQNIDKLHRVWPEVDVGIYSAALGKRMLMRDITYATIGSVYKLAAKLGRVDVVICDEAHLLNPKEKGMWRMLIAGLRKYTPECRVIGLTGTPFRGDGVWLTADADALFGGVAARVSMRELLDLGYLAPLRSAVTRARINTSGVKVRGGDYVMAELAKASADEALVADACAEIKTLAEGRKRMLVFCVTVEHAQMVAKELRRIGIRAAAVHGEMRKAEREDAINRFRQGWLRCLVNVAVLTTGFDVPEVDFIALLRATKSPVLLCQIAGRGMRVVGTDINESIRNGKADCLWADFTSTTEELGPVDMLKGKPPKQKGSGQAPFKVCDNCGARCATATLRCPECGFEFPPPKRINHQTAATGAAIMQSEIDRRYPTVEVTGVRYALHQKPGGTPSMRVEYQSGLVTVAKEWVPLEHFGAARTRAETWWIRARVDHTVPVPANAAEAVEWANAGALRKPWGVRLDKTKQYPEVIGHVWNKPVEQEAA